MSSFDFSFINPSRLREGHKKTRFRIPTTLSTQNMMIPLSAAILLFLAGWTRGLNVSLSGTQQAKVGSKVCMTDLGCFELTEDFFHPIYRPINFLPQDRATIDTQFHLYTKLHPMEFHVVKHSDSKSMWELDNKHRTVFIVHGFIDSKYYGKWMENLKDNILLHSDFNVIIVDWSKGNGAPYTKATANSRVVGAELALLIESIIKYRRLDPMKIHIIGHSLGAHIAGYAGERLKKLGRITALDPASPYFQFMPPSVRLDPKDADFVDVIHTDAAAVSLLALGMNQECGHVDFYPNNGQKQPGCGTAAIHSIFLEGLIDVSRRFTSCNHQRAVDFFIYSINYKRAQPVGFACNSWTDFLNGQCADCTEKKCAIMGIQAEQYRRFKDDSKSMKMYLATSSKAPFWEYTFQVTMKLFKPDSGTQEKRGTFNLKLEGSENSYDIKISAKDLEHGSTYTYLVRESQSLGTMRSLTFTWTSSTTSKKTLSLEYIIVKSMNVNSELAQKLNTKKFCNREMSPLESKVEKKLTLC